MTSDGPVTFELDGPDALERRLTAIAGARREAARVRSRIGEVEQELERLEDEVQSAVVRLGAEEADVRQLQSFTLRGILADLRGRKGRELEREVAQLADARHELVTLRERQGAVVAELDGLQDRLVALGDLDAEWADAVAARERWVAERGEGDGARLVGIAEALGDIEDELHECEEVRVAAVDALSRLDDVADALGEPSGWAGGVDDEQLDELCVQVRSAEDAIRRLARELQDIGVELSEEGAAAVQRWDRAFEGFLSGVATDEALDRRAATAAAVVDRAQVRVGRIAAEVEERSSRLASSAAALQEERAELRRATVLEG